MARPTSAEAQARASGDTWNRGAHVASYANRTLRPAEVMLLISYRDALKGRVLEVGCGAGRVIGYLIALGGEVKGIDISARMIEYCRNAYPTGAFSQGDMRQLSTLESGSLDVVLAMYGVLDVVSDAERHEALDVIHRLLAPDGLLIFSAHNHGSDILGPTFTWRQDPLRRAHQLVYAPLRIRNRRALRRYEIELPDYSIRNDSAHNWSVLHYYITRDAQERQLAGHGFELLECLDLQGVSVGRGEDAADCPELHYVARRAEATR
jgi:SAM-dependent methyltransferase